MKSYKNKQPRAENLLMLMEWLRLGKTFYIHKEFLLFLNIEDIGRLCLATKHYFHKYLIFASFHHIGVNSYLLDYFRVNFQEKSNIITSLDILKEGESYDKKVTILRKMYQCNYRLKNTIGAILKKT